ncbi:MAG: RNA polymerase sigma factor [Clostridia bacterium]|nr:RNA polymerase sigma factor [Clostridia bacterium]
MLPIILAIRDENDRDFVEGIYNRYKRNMVSKASVYLSSEHDVEDCVQDVVVTLIEHLEECYEWKEEHIKNFLMKCTRCVAINKYKENARRYINEVSVSEFDEEGDLDIPDKDECIEAYVIDEENVRRLAQMLEDMDPLYGDILYFRSFMGMKNTEIAKMLDIPVNTVNQRVLRARKMLMQCGVNR